SFSSSHLIPSNTPSSTLTPSSSLPSQPPSSFPSQRRAFHLPAVSLRSIEISAAPRVVMGGSLRSGLKERVRRSLLLVESERHRRCVLDQGRGV
ncbi:hypothetical protein CSUI_007322, partial [Cystoisospora suis]